MPEIMRVENLRKEFGKTVALKDISFCIEKGEVFGYLGPNGSGKTTTIRIFLGILRPTSGRAILFDEDISKDSAKVRERIGFVLEDQRFYERLSAYDNLEYFARIYQVPKGRREEKIKRLLEFVGLWGNKDQLIGKFSKGMKQRLAIARSLVHDPEVLFYDEPTIGLDPEIQVIVRDLIVELVKEGKKTIFLNSHNLDEVQKICSKVAILKKGEILMCDSLKKLRSENRKPEVEVTLDNMPEDIIKEIKVLDFVTDCEQKDNKIIFRLKETAGTNDILKYLLQKNLKVREVKEVTKTLEDVYLEVMKEQEE